MSIFKRTINTKSGKSQYWYVQLRHKGKVLTKSVGRVGKVPKALVKRYEDDLKKKLKLGYLTLDDSTFSDFASKFVSYLKNVKRNKSWHYAEIATKDFGEYYGEQMLSEITSADVENYKEIKFKEGKAPATIKKNLDFVRHLFNHAMRTNKYYGVNPVSMAASIPIHNQRTRVLTKEEEARLLIHAEEPLRSLIIISLNSGLRLNEARSLRWEDIDLENNIMVVDATMSKVKRRGIRYMNTVIKEILLEARRREGEGTYVFPEAMKVTSSALSNRFRYLCQKLEIDNLRFHDLRHTCGTRLAELGYDVSTIAQVLGHSTLQMSMRYVHPKQVVKDALEKLANTSTNSKI